MSLLSLWLAISLDLAMLFNVRFLPMWLKSKVPINPETHRELFLSQVLYSCVDHSSGRLSFLEYLEVITSKHSLIFPYVTFYFSPL